LRNIHIITLVLLSILEDLSTYTCEKNDVSVESIKWGKNQKKYHTIRRNPKSTRQIVKTEACFIPLTYIYMTAEGPSWSHGSWIYNYLCNQFLSPLTLWVRIPLRRGVFGTSLCNKVCQWLTAGRWFSLGTPVSSTNKTNRHGITEILLKVALSTINLPTYLPTYLWPLTIMAWCNHFNKKWLGCISINMSCIQHHQYYIQSTPL
jgi:hypothetical protein